MSRDDSDLNTMLDGIALGTAPAKSGGLKGRLRRALSLGHALDEEQELEQSPVGNKHGKSASGTPDPTTPTDNTDASSTIANGGDAAGPPLKKRSRAASLFSARLNASTDNISLSSTMSSASVVIRKIGSIGKLARRNSLAGITSLFKDKNKDQLGDSANNNDSGGSISGKKSKSKRSKDAKGSVLEPTVSHAVAELDRTASGSEWSDASLSGLSPAAKLARQHTLKSNAEAAAKARAQAEAQAQATAQAQAARGANAHANGGSTNGSNAGSVPVPATWEKSTATGRDSVHQGRRMVGEDGRVLVEDDSDSGSDVGHAPAHQPQQQSYISDGWEDDEVWREDEDEEEDLTVRPGGSVEDEEVVEWAKTIRKTIETIKPMKGILKGAENYHQEAYIQDQASNPAFNRIRSSSYSSHSGTPELGPLARIPSPDPDHIDGLHRHPSHSSASQRSGGNSGIAAAGDSGRSSPHTNVGNSAANGLFTLSNSSAPALSTITATATLPHRTSSAPTTKRLVFANNLSVYDTFSSTVYDRRSEPATWSRLTPTLAQRIKEELNSYKMEEMEVHACSRVYTQFFI